MKQIRCHICGWRLDELPWGDDGLHPTYNICDCCGCEFGYEDSELSGILQYRKKWIESGGVWFKPDEKPDNWSLKEQLNLIPKEIPAGIGKDLKD